MTGSPRPLSTLLGTLGLATLLSGCATASEAKPEAPSAHAPPVAAQAQPLAEAPDAGDLRTTTAGGSASCSAR